MTRPPLIALCIGLVGFVGLATLGTFGARSVMPSYLAAWLVLLALPLGALPVVMGLESLGYDRSRLAPALRRLVAVMPVAAILVVPVLSGLTGLYSRLGAARTGLPGWWMTPSAFIARTVVELLVWVALGIVFARPAAKPRPALAALGLGLHFVFGTLAATDWAMAVEPGFNSSAFGLMLILAQIGLAVSLATVLGITTRVGGPATRSWATSLVVLLAAWSFLQFSQYLVIWSANLPSEVLWYQHRSAGLGQAAEYSAGIVCALAFVSLLPRRLAARADVLAWVAAALAVMHGFEMLWLVTPAFRAEFSLTAADLLALAGTAGVGLGAALLLGERVLDPERLGHGAA